jgi:hypothetical protein
MFSALTAVNHWSVHKHLNICDMGLRKMSAAVPYANMATVGSSCGLLCAGKSYQLHTMQPCELPELFPEEAKHRENLLNNLRLSSFRLFSLIFLENLGELEYFSYTSNSYYLYLVRTVTWLTEYRPVFALIIEFTGLFDTHLVTTLHNSLLHTDTLVSTVMSSFAVVW